MEKEKIEDCECDDAHDKGKKDHKKCKKCNKNKQKKCKKCGKCKRGRRGPTGPTGPPGGFNGGIGPTGPTGPCCPGPTGPTGPGGFFDCESIDIGTGSTEITQVLVRNPVDAPGFVGPFAFNNFDISGNVNPGEGFATLDEDGNLILTTNDDAASVVIAEIIFNIPVDCASTITFNYTLPVDTLTTATVTLNNTVAQLPAPGSAPETPITLTPVSGSNTLTFTIRSTGEVANSLTISDFTITYGCCNIESISKEEFGAPIVFSAPRTEVVVATTTAGEPRLGIGFGTAGPFDTANDVVNGFIFRAPRNGVLTNLFAALHGVLPTLIVPPPTLQFDITFTPTISVYTGPDPENMTESVLNVPLPFDVEFDPTASPTITINPTVAEGSNFSSVAVTAGTYVAIVLTPSEISGENPQITSISANVSGAVLFV